LRLTVAPDLPPIVDAFADAGYAADELATATIMAAAIVRKPPDQVGFAEHSCRPLVDRVFARISRIRRLRRGPKATLASVNTFLYAAAVVILVRRLARRPDSSNGLWVDGVVWDWVISLGGLRMSDAAASMPPYSPQKLAPRFGCRVDWIKALTRRYHWPRVHGGNGG
jgi:hypothetical protein